MPRFDTDLSRSARAAAVAGGVLLVLTVSVLLLYNRHTLGKDVRMPGEHRNP